MDASYSKANSPAYYGFSPDYYPSHHRKPYNNLASHASYAGPSYSTPSHIYAQPSSYSSGYSEPSYEKSYEKPSPYSFGYKGKGLRKNAISILIIF